MWDTIKYEIPEIISAPITARDWVWKKIIKLKNKQTSEKYLKNLLVFLIEYIINGKIKKWIEAKRFLFPIDPEILSKALFLCHESSITTIELYWSYNW